MLIKDITINEGQQEESFMVQRKAYRDAMAALSPYRNKKWLKNIDIPTNNPESLGIYVPLHQSFAPDPTKPYIKIWLVRVWISSKPAAEVGWDIIDTRDNAPADDLNNYYLSLKQERYASLKTPQMLSFIKEVLRNTGLFDEEDISEIYILSVGSRGINVSLPKMKEYIRDITGKYVKIYDYMLSQNVRYAALELALMNLKRYQENQMRS